MRKIIDFIIIFFLTSFVFCMGEPIKTWDSSVNTGDAYHEVYEVVPFKIDGLGLNGYYDIIPLPDEKVLIYKYTDDEANKRFKETALIYDFKDKSSKYLYRDRVVVDSLFYKSIILQSGKVLIARAYNYSIKLGLPRKTFLELFNPETEAVEYRITTDGWAVLLGEVEQGKVLLDGQSLGSNKVFNVQIKEIIDYDIQFKPGDYIKTGDRIKDAIRTRYYEGDLFLYSYGGSYLVTTDAGDQVTRTYHNLYRKNNTTGLYEKTATTNVDYDEVLISNGNLVGFGGEYGWTFSIPKNKYISGSDWDKKGKMHYKREEVRRRCVAPLDDGNVLITSGYGGLKSHGIGVYGVYNGSVEMYVVSEDRFVLFKTPNENGDRDWVKLSNGDILMYDSTDADLFRRKVPPPL